MPGASWTEYMSNIRAKHVYQYILGLFNKIILQRYNIFISFVKNIDTETLQILWSGIIALKYHNNLMRYFDVILRSGVISSIGPKISDCDTNDHAFCVSFKRIRNVATGLKLEGVIYVHNKLRDRYCVPISNTFYVILHFCYALFQFVPYLSWQLHIFCLTSTQINSFGITVDQIFVTLIGANGYQRWKKVSLFESYI